MTHHWRAVPCRPLGALVAALTIACSPDVTPPGTEREVVSLRVLPSAASLVERSFIQLVADVRDTLGNPITGIPLQWSSADTTVLLVSEGGVASAVAPGLDSVYLHAGSKTAVGVVRVLARVVALSISPLALVSYPGDVGTFTAIMLDRRGLLVGGRKPVWSLADSSFAHIDADGRVSSSSVGRSRLMATIDSASDTATYASLITMDFVFAGAFHTCATTVRQDAYCWGANDFGQSGSNDFLDSLPTPVLMPAGVHLRGGGSGQEHSCAIATTGDAFCWGDNGFGQLGSGTSATRSQPTRVSSSMGFTQVSAGSFHSCAIGVDSLGYCWGRNDAGQLGSAGGSIGVPRAVGTPRLLFVVASGAAHTCATATNGDVLCWGQNQSGQLGDGTTTDRGAPNPVSGGLQASQVSAGTSHTCAVATTGDGYCWGDNSSGQLGASTPSSNSALPVLVGGLHTWKAIGAGARHTCGIDCAGSVWCWGDNFFGQLGNGGSGSGSTPRAVAGNLIFSSLTVGQNHACGLASDHRVYCWGLGGSGRLGKGSTGSSPIPVAVAFQN